MILLRFNNHKHFFNHHAKTLVSCETCLEGTQFQLKSLKMIEVVGLELHSTR